MKGAEAEMTWQTYHRRGDVLRAVVEELNRRRDGVLPMHLSGVAETFDDALALLSALQLRWHTLLAGMIERQLMEAPTDPEAAVLKAWRATAARLPGVRAALDAAEAAPQSPATASALETAHRKDWVLMAAMSGRAGTWNPQAITVGRELEQRARRSLDREPALATT